MEVPLENLVLREDGFKRLLTAFNTQRCLNPAISLGLAEGAFDETLRYVRDRTIFGKPIGEFQGARWKLADMYKDIEAARGLLYRACMTADPFPDPFLAATAKVFCNEMAIRVTNEAVQLHGGFGFTDEYPVSRLYRGARYGSLGGGASETLRDLIGKKLMAEDPGPDGILARGLFLKPRGPSSAKAAPCGSSACRLQPPPGTAIGPISTCPPAAATRAAAASMSATVR